MKSLLKHRAWLGLCVLLTAFFVPVIHADTTVYSNESCGYDTNHIFEETYGPLHSHIHTATANTSSFDRVHLHMRADELESPEATLRIYQVDSATVDLTTVTPLATSAPVAVNTTTAFIDTTFALDQVISFVTGRNYLFLVRAESEPSWSYPEALRFAGHYVDATCDFWDQRISYTSHSGAGGSVDTLQVGPTIVLAKSAPTSPHIVYDESIASGWSDWSWGTTLNQSSTTHFSGTYGLGLIYASAWAGLYLGTDGVDTTPYQSLSFNIHGGSTGGQSLYVSLYDENYSELTSQLITPYVQGGAIVANAWRNVRIPLADLDGLHRTVTGIQLQSASATTVTIDNLALSTLGTSEALYKDGFGTDWSVTGPWNMSSISAQATPTGKIGTYALEANFAQAWAGFEIGRSTPIDTRHKRALVFRIRGVTNSNLGQLYVAVRDANNTLRGWVPVTDQMITVANNAYTGTAWYTVTIPLSVLDAQNMQLSTVAFMTGEVTQAYLDEMYLVEGLEFPLLVAKYYDYDQQAFVDTPVGAYTARISSILDHHMNLVWDSGSSTYKRGNCIDNTATAYTGEEGASTWGAKTVPASENSCGTTLLSGYKQESLADFSVGGQYFNPDEEEYLFYDGHSGYDYPTGDGTPVYATTDGVVSSSSGSRVDVDHGNGYTSNYLHLTTLNVSYGQSVRAGVTKIGTTGSGHLHYTLMLYGERVDPYGWIGNYADPARAFAVNVPLWK